MTSLRVKICGLSTPETTAAAVDAGAAYVGFVFFPKSPRALTATAAGALASDVRAGVCKMGLFVDPDDTLLDETLSHAPLDMIQLQGSETPDRVAEVRSLTGLPVMKAVGISTSDDLPRLDLYEEVADQLLCDAKPVEGAVLPGGNGVAFDWRVIAGRTWRKPWMLAGGLTAENVAEAARLTGASQVDVSSGVESAPGVKDIERIEAFIAAAKGVAA
ncbi:MAG: phosphoribosylanthranilate isomerase [Pseudomonadota bacterium]